MGKRNKKDADSKFKFLLKECARLNEKIGDTIKNKNVNLAKVLKAELLESKKSLEVEYLELVESDFEGIHYDSYTSQKDMILKLLVEIDSFVSENRIERPPSDNTLNQAGPEIGIKLPKFELPTFNGNVDNWISFKEIFCSSIIQNSKLSDVDKFQYLSCSLKGPALQLIKGFPISEANFSQAWETLVSRYDNKRILANNQLSKLFNLKCMKPFSQKSILEILDTCNEAVRNLETLDFKINPLVNLMIVYVVQTKLDDHLRTQWELTLDPQSFPTYSDLTKFLEKHARGIQNTKEPVVKGDLRASAQPKRSFSGNTLVNNTVVKSQSNCIVCQKPHPIYKCQDFQNMTLDQRWNIVKSNKLCINCFRNNHFSKNCLLTVRCKHCNKKHHSLLHETVKNIPSSINSECVQKDNDSTCLANQAQFSSGNTLLSTALIKIKSGDRKWTDCRALVDNGSQRCLIASSFFKGLHLNSRIANHKIRGINDLVAETSLNEVTLIAKPHFNQERFELNALVVERITMNLPNFSLNSTMWPHLEGLTLADPNFHISSPIDLLIGADLFFELISGEKILGPKGAPCALNSKLGWLLSGPVYDSKENSNLVNCHAVVDQELNSTLQRFWQVEAVPELPQSNSCESQYLKTVKKISSGRYQVDLPFKSDPVFADSKSQALKRLYFLESKFRKDPNFKSQYNQFIEEYVNLNHMELVPVSEEDADNKFYLPHHGVLREDSSTTKLRVVFDASAKDSNGHSLNDHLEIGPKLLPELFKILLRFRTYKVAVSADIEKMYRQILVNPKHVDYQRILWRAEETQPILTYRLLTVTYGTACAPYLAVRTLQKLAEDNELEHPIISSVIKNNFYMDDLLGGSHSVEEASSLVNELNPVMESAGFSLRKWSSNVPEAISSLPDKKRYHNSKVDLDENKSIKLLGLIWNSVGDTLQLKISEPADVKTKRDLLSVIAKTFDPLGFLSPATVMLKIMLQALWKDGVSWSEPIPEHILNQWRQFKEQLSSLKKIKIPRYVEMENPSECLIAGFADASLKAYAAVIYLVNLKPNGNVVHFLAAKTKVAPLSPLTLPRLELAATLLLSQLTVVIQETLPMEIKDVRLFTDSQIALSWIHSPPAKGNPFVSNRVQKIKNLVPNVMWHHVSGKSNPADCASRGILPDQLLHHDLWWNGPRWLREEDLQSLPVFVNETATDPEVQTLPVEVNPVPEFFLKYSSFTKLIRVMAYCFRFVNNCRQSRLTGPLTSGEINASVIHIVKTLQASEFSREIHLLQKKSPLPSSNRLLTLNVFLDESGIIRVGGRLTKHQTLTIDQKHPMLLPKDHAVTNLIIEHYHVKNCHAGPQLTLSLIRQKFWFTGGRSKVRQIINKCLLCKRLKALPCKQIMSDLPEERITSVRPFQKVGIDFCGPVITKPNMRRSKVKIKSYICVFICLCTKAVHLEVVSDLSTQSLLACLRRFVSRRGLPSDIFSDNGKNFVGLSNEFKALFKLLKSEDVQHFASSQSICWHFIPPYAPNFGGIWESAVKSAKSLLVRTCKSSVLNFEELTTFLCQVEALLNSRPLVPMSSDPSDIAVLTPGHFLIGSSMCDIPESPRLVNSTFRLSERWLLIQKMRANFWTRWSRDYLQQLQQRPKSWSRARRDLQVGDLVLVHDQASPPLRWLLGRVSHTFPGKDGHVRVLNIKTSTGQCKRPASRVTLLLPAPEDVPSGNENSSAQS